MNLNPDISIIILNYNGLKDTEELLKSLVLHTKGNYEVILVDNGSKVDEGQVLLQKFSWITCIRTEKNLGFAGGNNTGIRKSRGKYFLLLNNDTVLEDDSVNKMAKFMEENPVIGAISPKLLYNDPVKNIQYAGFTKLSRVTLRNKCIGNNQPDSGQYMTPVRTAYTHGAAMMVRREVVEKAGGMEEDFFLYYEELDWCERIRSAGYEIWYYPYASVIHKESRSTGRNSAAKRYYMTRNRLIFASRHRKGTIKSAAILYQIFIASTAGIIRSLSQGRVDLAVATISGIRDFIMKKYGQWQR
jgi:GT2 family glycosyltransferase